MSGLVSVALYKGIKKFILDQQNPLRAGFYSLPLFYGVTLFINLISIVHDGPKREYTIFTCSIILKFNKSLICDFSA
jgi:sodium-dependent phosphate transporter